MNARVLITGGAGFIGSHVADELLAAGRQVRVLDNLSPQVHGENREWPDYLCDDVECVKGDVRDPAAVERALDGCDEVIHLAAKVGVGQSMYEVVSYTDVNNVGTATLLEALIRRPVRRLVVASSMSVYGEGLYRTRASPRHAHVSPHRRAEQDAAPDGASPTVQRNGAPFGRARVSASHASPDSRASPGSSASHDGRAAPHPDGRGGSSNGHATPPSPAASAHRHERIARTLDQLKAGRWEPAAPDGRPLDPIATPESKGPNLSSIYALSKYDQERMSLMVGRAYHIPTVALRFFNIYGPRQALSNPYTGVLAIFASRLLNDKPPLVFEDGRQQRDFVSVHDVGRACRLALETPAASVAAGGGVFNVGSGRHYTIRQLAGELARVMGKTQIEPRVTGDYRVGDIRHCFADIDLARRVLGYQPQVTLADGMAELAQWLKGRAADDRADEARAELLARGLSG